MKRKYAPRRSLLIGLGLFSLIILVASYFYSMGVIIGSMNMIDSEDCNRVNGTYLNESSECIIGDGESCGKASRIPSLVVCKNKSIGFRDHISTMVLLGSTLEEVQIE